MTMRKRIHGFLIGIVFGVVLCWSGMSSPEVIRQALLFQQSYLFLFMFSAIAVATAGNRLLASRGAAVPVRERPQRRHIVGAMIFGVGWGVACACPGPILTQLGQGIGWAVFTCAGAVTGIYIFHRTSPVAKKAEAKDSMEFAAATTR